MQYSGRTSKQQPRAPGERPGTGTGTGTGTEKGSNQRSGKLQDGGGHGRCESEAASGTARSGQSALNPPCPPPVPGPQPRRSPNTSVPTRKLLLESANELCCSPDRPRSTTDAEHLYLHMGWGHPHTLTPFCSPHHRAALDPRTHSHTQILQYLRLTNGQPCPPSPLDLGVRTRPLQLQDGARHHHRCPPVVCLPTPSKSSQQTCPPANRAGPEAINSATSTRWAR